MRTHLHPGKRICALVLSLLCLVSPAYSATAAEADQEPADSIEVAKETTLTTAVHHYGYYGSTVIGQIENGTKVTVLNYSSGYYKVDLYDMVGYIAVGQLAQSEDGVYYVNCQSESAETLVLEYESMVDALTLRHSILAMADTHEGTPYVYGGSRPGGFDCSGFTYYLYGQHGYSLNRRASMQLQNGIVVSKESMMVGDLVFFHESWDPCEASHVGIYAGNNTIIHSGSKGICYADLDIDWFAENFLCARRVINTAPIEIQELSVPSADPGACTVRSISGRTAH